MGKENEHEKALGESVDGVFDANTMDHWWPPAEEAAVDEARRLEYIVEEYSKGDVYLPYIMGRGRLFFPDGTPPTKLRLVESKMISLGTLALIYQPDKK